jgi:hypothetical protein
VGEACETHGGGEKSMQGFGGKAPGIEALGRPRKMGSEWIVRKIGWGCSGFSWLRIDTSGRPRRRLGRWDQNGS